MLVQHKKAFLNVNLNSHVWALLQPRRVLKAHLHHGQDFWQRVLSRRDRRQQAEEVVGWGVGQHLEIVWGILWGWRWEWEVNLIISKSQHFQDSHLKVTLLDDWLYCLHEDNKGNFTEKDFLGMVITAIK